MAIGAAELLAERIGSSWWNETILLALAQAPAVFAESFFRRVLQADLFGRDRTVLELAVLETRHHPDAAFLAVLEEKDVDAARLLFALRNVVERKSPELVERARALVDHADPAVAVAAAEAAGVPVPTRSGGTRRAASAGQARVVGPAEIEMVSIPGGRFRMGSEDVTADEKPVHPVDVSPFWLARHPVTNAQYARLLAANPNAPRPAHWSDRRLNQPDQPVVGVSWHDARAFCEWAGLRLPSEAEWESACRAGTTTTYSFGDDPEDLLDHGWFFQNSGTERLPSSTKWDAAKLGDWGCTLQAVGQKQPNPWGLLDMHGNVWEWCEDTWHANYQGASTNGSAWVDRASWSRVCRGGSFRHSARSARSAYRTHWHPAGRDDDLGFRPALST